VKVFYSKINEYLGDAVYGDKRTIEIYENYDIPYDIIFSCDSNKVKGWARKKDIVSEIDVNKIEKKGIDERCIVKSIYVNQYIFQDKTGDWIHVGINEEKTIIENGSWQLEKENNQG
jgi:hypothetical protein